MTFKSHENFTTYKGSWENGEFKGIGMLILKNGEKYIGGWEQGSRSGKGIYFFSAAADEEFESYKGDWSNDLYDGTGILT